jgi:CRISPR/Cas system-associated endoribonuclease Cas2
MRIQYSVFSVAINTIRYAEMIIELQEIPERYSSLSDKKDSIIAARISRNTDMRYILGKEPGAMKEYLIID